ncbi:MAG: sulfotransferase [Candidatus Jettenia caeni]|nr:MAG: sulfotransferase [Candidatus Jettenia caeni]
MAIKLPNFLIVGAARSGTTSLYQYLKQHPEIYMSPLKEPNFLSSQFKKFALNEIETSKIGNTLIKTSDDYKRLFENVRNEKAIGEASTESLYFYEDTIKQIKTYLGDVKIIIILREPVERAFSYYVHLVKEFGNFLSFEDVLEQEKESLRDGWSFYGPRCKRESFYYNQVKAYVENFNHVKILFYDDLQKDAFTLVKDIYKFLEIDTSFIPDVEVKFNISGIPKNKVVNKLLATPEKAKLLINFMKLTIKPFVSKEIIFKISKLVEDLKMKNMLEKPQIKQETYENLKNLYREDILKLQELINKDLSHWLRQ